MGIDLSSACTNPVYSVEEAKISKIRPVFLDADGVLWKDSGAGSIFGSSSIDSFTTRMTLMRNIFPLSTFFIVSNQTCVARGMYGEPALRERIYTVLDSMTLLSTPIVFSYCPHHPNAQVLNYRRNCKSRKPSAEQISHLVKQFDLSINESLLIGDRITDLEAAEKVGIREKYLIRNNSAFEVNEGDNDFVWSQFIEFRFISELHDLARFI